MYVVFYHSVLSALSASKLYVEYALANVKTESPRYCLIYLLPTVLFLSSSSAAYNHHRRSYLFLSVARKNFSLPSSLFRLAFALFAFETETACKLGNRRFTLCIRSARPEISKLMSRNNEKWFHLTEAIFWRFYRYYKNHRPYLFFFYVTETWNF